MTRRQAVIIKKEKRTLGVKRRKGSELSMPKKINKIKSKRNQKGFENQKKRKHLSHGHLLLIVLEDRQLFMVLPTPQLLLPLEVMKFGRLFKRSWKKCWPRWKKQVKLYTKLNNLILMLSKPKKFRKVVEIRRIPIAA